ncbi:PREDICTED: MATH domain-containing protein At5g43560-like [Camelina sativa]|uniref:MATH domain-containing protein At5g43560-like n=1 Tax=Camelina sativa TaxID=90675 RepID=A0ABM0UL49_CAMSA|nr:PREDICTED: MATH domain-containing protein At5g43560-like [Camelina sativa]
MAETDQVDDGYGLKLSELFGKHTCKIEEYSVIDKKPIRSRLFEVGGCQWYILVYPEGCDVSGFLSLFLCVGNYDQLLPGWSHLAQFTMSVVNKDPKRSKFSDTLHQFWKKEHDWGWKKFMELPNLKYGFIDDFNSLTITAQVQVIRERVDRPFRCLDNDYRRELVRVYLPNVELIFRRFVQEKRSKLEKLMEDKARWTSLRAFWSGMDQDSRRGTSREKMNVILTGVVKCFFIKKEVTSTLVMDYLYSALKDLEGQTQNKKAPRMLEAKELPAPVVSVDKDMFVLDDDVLLLLERAVLEPMPPKDERGPQNRIKAGNNGEEFDKESYEHDEMHLTELGRRVVEICALFHIFSKIEVAHQEVIVLKMQEELIREEEEAGVGSRGGQKKLNQRNRAKPKRNK